MSGPRWSAYLLITGLLLAAPLAPSGAASETGALSRAQPRVTWQGAMTSPVLMGCNGPTAGCDRHQLDVAAPRGTWITVSVDQQQASLRVTRRGDYVASGGMTGGLNPADTPAPTTTFQQVASGRVRYEVAVGSTTGSPLSADSPYTATARLAGNAFDRSGDCGATPGAEHLLDPDPGERLRLSVRLVSGPSDAAATRVAARALVETYARIRVDVRVSFDVMPISGYRDYPYEVAQRAYGGLKPRGVDVVHVLTDDWSGGFADCIGGVAYPERGFSVGSLSYTIGGVVPVPVGGGVPAGLVAAHEIGHQLGAQHQQVSCVEAVPQQLQRPASDGWVGPCTVMAPLAPQASEAFSTLERVTIRSYVRRYAGRDAAVRPRHR